MSDHDFKFESQPGLPAPLPPGETLLWQGRPDTATLAREAFAIRWITGYLVVIALYKAGASWADGGAMLALARLLPYLALAAAGYGAVYLMAWLQARATIYSITSARVILRIGAAVPMTFTIPFTCIDSASLALHGTSGAGTVALQTRAGAQLAYAVIWPHARPWKMRRAEPALRAIPDAGRIARLLADAAAAKVNEPRISRIADSAGHQPGDLVAAE